MRVSKSHFLAVVIVILTLVVLGCSPSSSIVRDAEKAFRTVVESESKGQIKLVSFTKKDGRKIEAAGDQSYELLYDAEIIFESDGTWITSATVESGIGFNFEVLTGPRPKSITADLLNLSFGGKPVSRGDHAKVSGKMVGQKFESGWKFNIGSGEISVGPSARRSDSRTFGAAQGQASQVPPPVSSASSATEAKYRKKAEKGDAQAQFELARLLYRDGDGPIAKKDQVEAVEWLRKSAEQGNAEAQWGLAGRYDLNLFEFDSKSEEGQRRLAAYYFGKADWTTTEANKIEAEKWYRKAAEQGDPSFQFHLGYKYDIGASIPGDDSLALDWYRKAANQGYSNAAFRLKVLLDPARLARLECKRNLQNIVLGLKAWAIDHDDRFPFNVSSNKGGTMELSSRGDDGFERNAAIHFRAIATARAIASELSSPKVFVCPADTSKHAATNLLTLQDMNVSYRLRSGSDVDENHPEEVLAECPIHGTVALCDGSVQLVSKKR